jgi:hypothetical protein
MYKAAGDMAPNVAANFANCAAAALMLRQYREAADFAGHAASLDPTFVRAHMRAGKACLLMGRFDQVSACPNIHRTCLSSHLVLKASCFLRALVD